MPAATSLNKCYTKTQFPFASTGKKKSNLMNSPQNIDLASKLHEGVLSSYHKKKEGNNVICSSMGGPKNYHIECSKSDKDKYQMISLICGYGI